MTSFGIIALIIGLLSVLIPLFISWHEGGWVSVYTSPKYDFDMIPDLTGNVAVVTGSNTGIGKVTVRELARKGATVILTSRNLDKGEQAKQDICTEIAHTGNNKCDVHVMILDLSSLASVYAFTKEFRSKFPKMNYLFLNAGVMACPFQLSVDGYEMQFATNHLGHFFLVEELFKLMFASNCRVTVVSSIAHTRTYADGINFNQLNNSDNYNPILAYGQSKLANILFSLELAVRTQAVGIKSNSLHPGAIQTDLLRHVDNAIESIGIESLSQLIKQIKDIGFNMIAMDVNQGAYNQLLVGTSPELKNVSRKYFNPVGKETQPSKFGQNGILGRRLWKESAAITAKWKAEHPELVK